MKYKNNEIHMHEFSLAQSLFSSVLAVAKENKVEKVTSIYVKVGQFAMIMEEQFQFALDIIKEEYTLTKEAEIVIDREPGVLRCKQCSFEGQGDDSSEPNYGLIAVFSCRKCGSYDTEVISGMESYIDKIDVELSEENVSVHK